MQVAFGPMQPDLARSGLSRRVGGRGWIGGTPGAGALRDGAQKFSATARPEFQVPQPRPLVPPPPPAGLEICSKSNF